MTGEGPKAAGKSGTMLSVARYSLKHCKLIGQFELGMVQNQRHALVCVWLTIQDVGMVIYQSFVVSLVWCFLGIPSQW